MARERLTNVIRVLNEEAMLDRLADYLRAVLEGWIFRGRFCNEKKKKYQGQEIKRRDRSFHFLFP